MKRICIIYLCWIIIQQTHAGQYNCFKATKLRYNNSHASNYAKQMPFSYISSNANTIWGYELLYSYENQLINNIYLASDIGFGNCEIAKYEQAENNNYTLVYDDNLYGFHASI